MNYKRYAIHTELTPNLAAHPNRFEVKVDRLRLAALLIQEVLEARGRLKVVTSRPCVYGVFSGPVGGFLPRPQHCVGCLRCTIQYPEVVQIHPGKDRLELGDSYFDPDKVDTVLYEAATGRIPVRGAGYGGPFGGSGWDGMWTDMSEIVRPTRDGIHGREFISTQVDLGSKPLILDFDPEGKLRADSSRWIPLAIPYLFDLPMHIDRLELMAATLQQAAFELETRLVLPVRLIHELDLGGDGLTPLLDPSEVNSLAEIHPTPDVIELLEWDSTVVKKLREAWPTTVVGVRTPFGTDVVPMARDGVDFIHLFADYHGGAAHGFVLDSIRQAHLSLVEEGIREGLSLIGSGGIAAAEHVPKAIICGLDAVALDTPLLVALQGRMSGETRSQADSQVVIPAFPVSWGVQRIRNLVGSWRDQLLEILGAMGLREVRRLRGEIGRAMFQQDLEKEAFAEIEGFGGSSHG